MHYVHQAQLSEIDGLPVTASDSVQFWTGNIRHLIVAQSPTSWSLLESTGALVGEFVREDDGFAVVDDDGFEADRFDHWRSAVRNIVRRAQKAA